MTSMACSRCSTPDNIHFVEDIILHLLKVHGLHGLRFDYTLDDLQRVARAAAATTRAMAGDYDDRYAEAFSAAAEHLYAAEHWIPEHDLFRAAQDALWEASRKQRSYQGCAYRHGEGWGDNGTGPKFVRYWREATAPSPSPEPRIVERTALYQILATLTERQREVIHALAALGDHTAAREAIGGNKCYAQHLSNARRRFLELWHEGEAPSKPWGQDRRGNHSPLSQTLRRHAKAKAGGQS